jgi:hypothetical protein
MKKASITLIAAAAALTLSGSAFAQNNTLATPSVTSPAAATANSSYGAPGAASTDSGQGTGSQNSTAQKSLNNGAAADTTAYGVNNSLARPSVTSPVK